MTLIEHLRELRTRLLRAVIALAIGTAVGYAVFPALLDLLIAPYCDVVEAGRENCNLIALKPLEPFSVRIRASLMVGLFVGGPVIFYQLWRFVTPGLTQRERRYTLPFVVLSQVMLGVGIVVAYLIIPQALRVLLTLGGPRIEAFLSASEYLSFFLGCAWPSGWCSSCPWCWCRSCWSGCSARRTCARLGPTPSSPW
jgi:sec-independent protein translocase protein TatC